MQCPYCQRDAAQESDDHIFPQFLGGKRTIKSCKSCNDRFGHTFEGEASSVLQSVHVFINSWGLPMAAANPVWKAAHVIDGESYDLRTAERGPTVIPSKPIIRTDAEGNITSFQARSRKEAENIKKGLLAAGKAKAFVLQRDEPITELKGIQNAVSINPAVRRTALKMCYAAAQLIDIDPGELEAARECLFADSNSQSDNLLVDFTSRRELDALRSALTHTIYVEINPGLAYGIVQFFGVLQIYSVLGRPKTHSSRAILGTLDPISGIEQFQEIKPLSLPPAPDVMSIDLAQRGVQSWGDKFREGAIDRGATHPPVGLYVSETDFGPPTLMPTSWSSSTVEFLFPKNSKS